MKLQAKEIIAFNIFIILVYFWNFADNREKFCVCRKFRQIQHKNKKPVARRVYLNFAKILRNLD